MVIIVQLTIHGISTSDWRIYGFASTLNSASISAALEPVHLSMLESLPLLRKGLHTLIAPLYENAFGFVFAAVCIRTLIFVLIYKIYLCITNLPMMALSGVLLLSFAKPAFGLVFNGAVGPFSLLISSVSLMLSLYGILRILHRNYLQAALWLGIACHLHPHYGAAIIAPIILGLILAAKFYQEGPSWRQVFGFLGLLVPILLPLSLATLASVPGVQPLPIATWYDFITMRDPDDVLLTFTLGRFGFALFSALVVYLLLRPKHAYKTADFILFGLILLFFLSLIVEAIHARGIFVPAFSELFLKTQFRRSFWMGAFLLIPLILTEYARHQNRTRQTLENLTLLGGVSMALLWRLPEFALGVITIASLLALIRQQLKSPVLPAVIAGLFGLALLSEFTGFISNGFGQGYLNSLYQFAVVFALAALIVWRAPSSINRQMAAVLVLAFVPLKIFYSHVLVKKSGIIQDWPMLTQLAQKPVDYPALWQAETANGSVGQAGFASANELDDFIDAMTWLGSSGLEKGPVLFKPIYDLDCRHYLKMAIALSEHESKGLSHHSRQNAQVYDLKLKSFFGQGIADIYRDRAFIERLDKQFNQLDELALKRAFQKKYVHYLVSEKKWKTWDALYENDTFSIYDLTTTALAKK